MRIALLTLGLAIAATLPLSAPPATACHPFFAGHKGLADIHYDHGCGGLANLMVCTHLPELDVCSPWVPVPPFLPLPSVTPIPPI